MVRSTTSQAKCGYQEGKSSRVNTVLPLMLKERLHSDASLRPCRPMDDEIVR